MKIDTLIQEATRGDGDPALAERVCILLRFNLGMTHKEILARVQRVNPEITEAQWDGLLYEAG